MTEEHSTVHPVEKLKIITRSRNILGAQVEFSLSL